MYIQGDFARHLWSLFKWGNAAEIHPNVHGTELSNTIISMQLEKEHLVITKKRDDQL
jgi:hypothetical protein